MTMLGDWFVNESMNKPNWMSEWMDENTEWNELNWLNESMNESY